MIFKIEETGHEKELRLYNQEGNPLDEEQERQELTGISNWVHQRLAVDGNSGVLAVSQEEFEWWKTHYAKMQARLFRLHHLKEEAQANDDTAIFHRILGEELDYNGEDHGDRRSLATRVQERLRHHYQR